MQKNIEYVAVSRPWIKKLAKFFENIVSNKDDKYFHPHPLTYDMAKNIAVYEGNDLYFLQIKDNEITGYGMLRGWDDGFTIPSLGIVIHPSFRNQGFGKEFMEFLHEQAKAKGATKVRLKVYYKNKSALQLYVSLGYTFSGKENGQLIGYYEL